MLGSATASWWCDVHVLHFTRRWGEPSHTFVRTLIDSLSSSATIACVQQVGSAGGDRPVVLDRGIGWLPGRARGLLRRRRLAALADANGVDVIHAHFRYLVDLAVDLARRRELPLVVAVHGHDVLHGDNPDRARRWLPAADVVLVPSRWLGERVEALGVPGDRIEVANAGIRLADHPFRERTQPDGVATVGFVGRYVEKKGVDHLIAALSRCGQPVRAVLVGHGALEPSLRAAATSTGLEVTFVDGTDPAAVTAAWEGFDVLVTPSRTAVDGDAETLCYVNLEAQARGLPVITSDHGGIPEGIAPDAALVVPEADVGALAQALAALLDHPERWAAMGRAGRRFVEERFDADGCARAMEARYRRLLDDHTRAATSPASSRARTSYV